jgi:hypothetical protein
MNEISQVFLNEITAPLGLGRHAIQRAACRRR